MSDLVILIGWCVALASMIFIGIFAGVLIYIILDSKKNTKKGKGKKK